MLTLSGVKFLRHESLWCKGNASRQLCLVKRNLDDGAIFGYLNQYKRFYICGDIWIMIAQLGASTIISDFRTLGPISVLYNLSFLGKSRYLDHIWVPWPLFFQTLYRCIGLTNWKTCRINRNSKLCINCQI